MNFKDMIAEEKEYTTKVKITRFSLDGLGQYCLLFKESCRNICLMNLTSTESAVLWYALGNMREDGQIYLNKTQMAETLSACYNAVAKAIAGLELRNLIMPVTEASGMYQVTLTHTVNSHLVFQGKLTNDKARYITEQIPRIETIQRTGQDSFLNLDTGEVIMSPSVKKKKKD